VKIVRNSVLSCVAICWQTGDVWNSHVPRDWKCQVCGAGY